MVNIESNQHTQRRLRQALFELLCKHFNLQEIRSLCFDLGENFENIEGGESLEGKVQALIDYMERRLLVSDLVQAARKHRPKVDWPRIPEQTIPVSFEPFTGMDSGDVMTILQTGFTDLDALIGG